MNETERRVIEAAKRFARAAMYARDTDVDYTKARVTAGPIEHLVTVSTHYTALADLANAERDLILAVRDHEREQAQGESA